MLNAWRGEEDGYALEPLLLLNEDKDFKEFLLGPEAWQTQEYSKSSLVLANCWRKHKGHLLETKASMTWTKVRFGSEVKHVDEVDEHLVGSSHTCYPQRIQTSGLNYVLLVGAFNLDLDSGLVLVAIKVLDVSPLELSILGVEVLFDTLHVT